MDAGDDMAEPSVSSSGLDSVDFGQGVTVHSPEDVAWADSCLTKDPDALENGWDSLICALRETSISQPESSAHEMDNFSGSVKIEAFSSSEGTGDMKNREKATIDVASSKNDSEPSSSDGSSRENSGGFWSRHNLDDVFLPTYNENLRNLETSDPELDIVLQTYKLDQPMDGIFKTWDLDIPPEEDDLLIKQLNEALTGSSLEPNPSDESKTWRSLIDAPLEDLISGINELSLSPN
ncbi:hypothetical protein F511_14839 [Dorcoceras hygrometricum]|uniref:Uncharacterized protein n=1 Tax=Dorcoceras hygrometricum TaxID=472368 RepID=A0A2Z7D1Y6_9LAMI|nr:hypothetical protein F511_14838 [Dorcoceras hygrometricum]KZV53473.1 hypothetical protein F511_14839 [Dorcoceras hygrometricum]